ARPSRPHRHCPQPSRGRRGQPDGLGRLRRYRAVDSGADLGVQADRRHRHPQHARSGAARDAGNDRAAEGQGPRTSIGARARAADRPGRQTVMMIAILIVIAASAIFWLIFFKFKWLRLTPGWALIFAFFVLHLTLVFLIGLRFVTPSSANATIVQHTIQLIPRLTGPALVTAVLVQDNDRVKKGQPLFQFDRRPYEDQVAQMEAQLAQAKQNVNVLKADVDIAMHKVALTLAQLTYERYEKHAYDILVTQNSAAAEDVAKWQSRVDIAESSHLEAEAELERANLNYHSQIDGVNTAVAENE